MVQWKNYDGFNWRYFTGIICDGDNNFWNNYLLKNMENKKGEKDFILN